MKYSFLILLLCLFTAKGITQVKCFARVELDRHSVYVQQPFKVTITVLTATWYTAPLDFDNIQIPNAFILPFDQTAPGMFDVGNKKYAGLTFYFIVFPYKAGKFSIPPIHITATTPPEGSAVSQEYTLKTPPQSFIVKPVPSAIKGSWFVAKNVFVNERWNKPLHNLKVGDIIERTITIDARGTLPQFIPPVKESAPAFASIYPQDPELDDTRNDYDANGKLTQTITYLLEKPGTFKIPAITVEWWNPLTSRLYTKTATAADIIVAQNPDLGILTSIKDSLSAKQPVTANNKINKGPKLIAGIPWYWFILYLLVIITVIYFFILITIKIYHKAKRAREDYLESEKYWFRKFLSAPANINTTIIRMFSWWGRAKLPGRLPSVSSSLDNEKYTEVKNEWKQILSARYSNTNIHNEDINLFKKEIKKYRAAYQSQQEINKISESQLPWT